MVVVIIGILSALAVPSFIRTTGESQLDGDAQTLFQDIQWAKLAAIRTSTPYFIFFHDSTVNGKMRLGWSVVDSATRTVRKSGVTGVSVRLGLPAGVSAPDPAAVPEFDKLGSISSAGFQLGLSGATQCANGSSESWSDSAKTCGGAVGDMETGAIYLYSERSDARAYVMVYNRSKNLSLKRFRYMGGAWEAM